MYDNPNLPYRCPLCFQVVSDCTSSADGKHRTCGCFTCSCSAPIFEQKPLESIYMPRILWDRWVIRYRNEHPNYHIDYLCKNCLRDRENCKYYDEEMINCPDAVYEENNKQFT